MDDIPTLRAMPVNGSARTGDEDASVRVDEPVTSEKIDSGAKGNNDPSSTESTVPLHRNTRVAAPERPLLDAETVMLRTTAPPPADDAATRAGDRQGTIFALTSRPNGRAAVRQEDTKSPAPRNVTEPGSAHGMDINDYLRVLRRGWPLVLVITLLAIALTSVYLLVAPRTYEASTALFVTASDPRNIGDLQGGTEFSSKAVTSYADIVASATVLGPAAAALPPGTTADSLATMVSASAPESTRLINIGVSAADPQQAALVANAVAATATRVIPTLEGTPDGRPLVAVAQIRPAVVPLAPASPDTEKTLVIGIVAGLCLGLGATIARQSLDTRIRRIEDVRALTDVPTLAVVPQARRATEALVVRDEPTGAGEAYRTLRTNLRFLETIGRRSLLFTAVTENREGAAVPANLAWSLAQAGRRVLLVDLDLRNTAVADVLGVKPTAGIADVLTGRADMKAVVVDTEHRRVNAVLAGNTTASPSDLLSAPMMAGLLRRMEHEYDYVILHAPALLTHSDAAVVAGVSGATFVTAEIGRTQAPQLQIALDALGNVQVRPFGIVLTEARKSRRGGRHKTESRADAPAVHEPARTRQAQSA